MNDDRYPAEDLTQLKDEYGYSPEDNGTMPENVDYLRQQVVGRRIVSAEQGPKLDGLNQRGYESWGSAEGLILTLDNGTKVQLVDTDDCCAYTTLREFFLHPESVNHMILGVGTTDGYTKWHIYADFGDIMELTVGWSAGNPFYYGYGFDILVKRIDE